MRNPLSRRSGRAGADCRWLRSALKPARAQDGSYSAAIQFNKGWQPPASPADVQPFLQAALPHIPKVGLLLVTRIPDLMSFLTAPVGLDATSGCPV